MSVLLASTSADVELSLIGGACLVIASAVPAIIAAVVAARTRKENREQHAEGQQKVEHLATVVQEQTGAINRIGDDVRHVKDVVTDHLRWHATAAEPTEPEGDPT